MGLRERALSTLKLSQEVARVSSTSHLLDSHHSVSDHVNRMGLGEKTGSRYSTVFPQGVHGSDSALEIFSEKDGKRVRVHQYSGDLRRSATKFTRNLHCYRKKAYIVDTCDCFWLRLSMCPTVTVIVTFVYLLVASVDFKFGHYIYLISDFRTLFSTTMKSTREAKPCSARVSTF